MKKEERRMRRRSRAVQEDLFGSSGEDLRREVRDLDERIANALRKKDFSLARELTARQEKIIKTLVENSDLDVVHKNRTVKRDGGRSGKQHRRKR